MAHLALALVLAGFPVVAAVRDDDTGLDGTAVGGALVRESCAPKADAEKAFKTFERISKKHSDMTKEDETHLKAILGTEVNLVHNGETNAVDHDAFIRSVKEMPPTEEGTDKENNVEEDKAKFIVFFGKEKELCVEYAMACEESKWLITHIEMKLGDHAKGHCSTEIDK
mmetsp:Transcript_36360/g.113286  ORF Transcript_36360/g.113286 Transcript_36360/m.113286 type:complete len:169 (+) Transcript_36360:86-592(+)